MCFSTRKVRTRNKAIALIASAAILGIGGTIGYLQKNEAKADTDIEINDAGATVLSKTYDDTYMATNYAQPLGVLGAFHIIGFEQLDLGNQTNGNILTPNLNSAGSYIGFEEPTISYARYIGTNLDTTFSFANAHDNVTNILVTGYQTNVGNADEGTKWTINSAKSNMPDRIVNGEYANNLWQEKDANQQFLDIASVKTAAESFSSTLRNYEDTLTSSDYDFTDQNNRRINVPASAQNSLSVLTLSKNDLVGHQNIYVYGFDQYIPGTLLINIDLAGETDFEMNNSFKICYTSAEQIKYPDSIRTGATSANDIDFTDNQRDCVRETWIHDKFENHVIVNFFDSESGTGKYTGDINIARETTSFVVAPDADVRITASSFQGIAITNTYTSTGADTFYLSLNDLQPITNVSYCTITVNHYLEGTTTKVADSETLTTICDHANKTIQTTSDFYDSTKNYTFSSAEYIEDDDTQGKTDITDDIPLTTTNTYNSQVYNLYYNEMCSYIIYHVNYYDADTVYLTQNGTVVCGEMIEIGHLQSLVDRGHVAVNYDGSVVETISTLAQGITDNPSVFTFKYKDPCAIDVYHRLEGTLTNLADPEHYDGYCFELEKTINPSSTVLESYDFVSAIETVSDDVINYNQFPYATGKIQNSQIYVIEYKAKSTPEPDTPNTLDKNPEFIYSAAGASIGLGIVTMLLARRRQ